ncbi:YfbU family protein [Pseudomonas sp. SD17-1]|uniref:YfbU family protein n=1 Tax=Pseudomonas TaxID=286 RepID=UPI001AE38F09|nr:MULTISPECIES: YfbU family protein [Pseudomonas]WEJ22976.1 YfbU family protein [Pseudomonas sp. SD17-1]
MQPTATERLIVEMLCEVYKKLEITDSYDPDIVARAMGSQDYWVLDWKYDVRDGDSETPPHVTAVVDTLDMYQFLQEAYEAFDDEQRQSVEAVGIGRTLEFPGYDGNNETDYLRAARYLVRDLDRFTRLQGSADTNSHAPLAPMYARMVEVFLPIRRNVVGRRMTVEEVVEVLNAAIHPDNR